MRCFYCPFHKSGHMSNACEVTGDENYREPDNCNLVNTDGSLNFDDEYIKMEYGDNREEKV